MISVIACLAFYGPRQKTHHSNDRGKDKEVHASSLENLKHAIRCIFINDNSGKKRKHFRINYVIL